MKFNIGCGDDYLEGFVNVDANDKLQKVDVILDISKLPFSHHLGQNSASLIYFKNILEHFFHYEAMYILKELYLMLKENGTLVLELPNFEKIINCNLPTKDKLFLIYGGQDIMIGTENDKYRKNTPQYYCHKFGWTKELLEADLRSIGYSKMSFKENGFNLIVEVVK